MSFKDYFSRRKKRILLQCLVLLFLSFVALAGYGMAVLSEQEKTGKRKAEAEPEMPVAQNEQKTGEDCAVTWEYIYEFCGHKVTAESDIEPDMTGLTLREFESRFKNIKVVEFSPNKLVLQKKISQYCPNHLILKLNEGALSVYRTDAGKDTLSMVYRVELSYSDVPERYRQALLHGEVFNSTEDVQKYIAEKLAH